MEYSNSAAHTRLGQNRVCGAEGDTAPLPGIAAVHRAVTASDRTPSVLAPPEHGWAPPTVLRLPIPTMDGSGSPARGHAHGEDVSASAHGQWIRVEGRSRWVLHRYLLEAMEASNMARSFREGIAGVSRRGYTAGSSPNSADHSSQVLGSTARVWFPGASQSKPPTGGEQSANGWDRGDPKRCKRVDVDNGQSSAVRGSEEMMFADDHEFRDERK